MSSKKTANLPGKPWLHASGHKLRPTGAGPHDPRPNRRRTRGQDRRASIRDQRD